MAALEDLVMQAHLNRRQIHTHASEAESFSSVPEQHVKRRLI